MFSVVSLAFLRGEGTPSLVLLQNTTCAAASEERGLMPLNASLYLSLGPQTLKTIRGSWQGFLLDLPPPFFFAREGILLPIHGGVVSPRTRFAF